MFALLIGGWPDWWCQPARSRCGGQSPCRRDTCRLADTGTGPAARPAASVREPGGSALPRRPLLAPAIRDSTNPPVMGWTNPAAPYDTRRPSGFLAAPRRHPGGDPPHAARTRRRRAQCGHFSRTLIMVPAPRAVRTHEHPRSLPANKIIWAIKAPPRLKMSARPIAPKIPGHLPPKVTRFDRSAIRR